MSQQSKKYPNLRRIPLVLNTDFPEDAELWDFYEPYVARRRASDDIRRRLYASIYGGEQPVTAIVRPPVNRTHHTATDEEIRPQDEDTLSAMGSFMDSFN